MIVDIIGTKFVLECEPNQVARRVFAKVREFMKENEYFHEEHFLEFIEEDYDFELAEAMSPADALISISQLEDWVEDAAIDSEEDPITDGDQELMDSDPEPEDDEPFDEEDDDRE